MQEKKPRSGNQMNMYLSDELAARVDAVALTLTKRTGGITTRQDVFKMAFEQWMNMLDTLNGKKE